ncbi:MAG: hypothetical protein IPK97_06305 [Ahniella sp.]|nr:hypothetical protein [Ahniella sp.]
MKSWFLKSMGWLAALMIPLCLGGLWSVLMQITRSELPWFALAFGLLAWPCAVYLAGFGRLVIALGCGLCSLAGMAYAHALASATAVSRLLGVDFRESLAELGVPMLLDLAWLRCSALELWAMALALLLAVGVGWWRAGRAEIGQESRV